jgi:hypothetical protein
MIQHMINQYTSKKILNKKKFLINLLGKTITAVGCDEILPSAFTGEGRDQVAPEDLSVKISSEFL